MSSQPQKSVFLIGPGFIGGTVLDLLVAENGRYSVKVLVRRAEQAEILKKRGAAETVLGGLNDKDVIEKNVAESDVTIHTATADHLPSVEAVLTGLRIRASRSLPAIFIHTSGTSNISDFATNGNNSISSTIYSDTKPELVDALAPDAPHRPIDLAIVNARAELPSNLIKTAIMTPPLIYGYIPDHGRLTIQIPTLVRFALKHGYSGYVGAGAGVESNIHVRDLARAYLVLLKHTETAEGTADLAANPYFFCETTGGAEPSWKRVAEVIGRELHRAGKIPSAEPRKFGEDSFVDLFGPATGDVIGLNSRSRAERLRKLGWEAKEKSWEQSLVEDELPVLLKESEPEGGFRGYRGSMPQ